MSCKDPHREPRLPSSNNPDEVDWPTPKPDDFESIARIPGKFADIAQMDGFKIEGLALKPGINGGDVLYAGTDDENFGATLRQISPLSAR